MPQVTNGPAGLNSLLEEVYSDCMKRSKNKGKCSRIAWAAAENAGWHKDKNGKWRKKSEDEMKQEEARKMKLAKIGGIKRNKKKEQRI